MNAAMHQPTESMHRVTLFLTREGSLLSGINSENRPTKCNIGYIPGGMTIKIKCKFRENLKSQKCKTG
jgi:hypothetical protein